MRHPSPNFPCPAIATRIWGRYHHPKDGTLGSFSDPAWICLVAKHVCSPKTEMYNLNLTSCGELKNFINSHLGLVGIQAFWKWCWLGDGLKLAFIATCGSKHVIAVYYWGTKIHSPTILGYQRVPGFWPIPKSLHPFWVIIFSMLHGLHDRPARNNAVRPAKSIAISTNTWMPLVNWKHHLLFLFSWTCFNAKRKSFPAPFK